MNKQKTPKSRKEIDDILIWGSSHSIPGYTSGPTKFDLFNEIRLELHGKLYWYALRETHIASDNRYKYRREFKEAFSVNEPHRISLMNNRERQWLLELPDKIDIYRGMTVDELINGDYGISWTLDKTKAEWFAFEYGRNFDTNHLPKTVHHLVIDKSEVVAFLGGRREHEIIYLQKSGPQS
ncbi:MAG: hypothetical protein JST83_05390 [Bacteroidetes bacterium]|nr:hypothetical protein [Bacteroidota bacterium]